MKFKIFILLLFGVMLISQAVAQEETEETQHIAGEEIKGGIRILLSTSGPAEFNSYWLDNPPRLVVEFRSKNILSKMNNEVIVNQGVIKRIISSYYEGKQKESLKSLTFELLKKVPYRIWQEEDTIILDIKTPPEISTPVLGEKEIFTKTETNNVISKRLEAMKATLTQVTERKKSSEFPDPKIDNGNPKKINKAAEKIVLPKTMGYPTKGPVKSKKGVIAIIFWLIGLTLISGSGFFVWHRFNAYKTKDIEDRLRELGLELQKSDKHLKHEEVVRKAIEKTALKKEREYKQLQLELQEKNKLLEQEEILRKQVEKAALEKKEEYEQLEDSYGSLKNVLIEKGLAKKAVSSDGKENLWIPGKSEEKRVNPRLVLTRDYNRTIILRIESLSSSEIIKTFADNISSEGLCFQSKKEFNEKEPLVLRLFFYGDRVPTMKIQAHIIWKKTIGPINYYGTLFDLLDEKDRLELNRYIESKIVGV